MKDRIVQVMESQHMNQQSFSNYIGVSAATLNSILKERTRPTLTIVEAICAKMPNINMSWLVTGQGDMYLPETEGKKGASDTLPFADDGLVASGSGVASAPQRDAQVQMGSLFDNLPEAMPPAPASQRQTPKSQRQQVQQIQVSAKNVDKQPRRITEIRVFYDDQTWESFVPKR